MRKCRIIAALLTGTMLCSSVPVNIRASDLDAVFDDGKAAAEDTDEVSTVIMAQESFVPAAVPLTSFEQTTDEPVPAVQTEGCSRSPLSIGG